MYKRQILYGRPDATDDEMIAAAKRAEAHDFILNLRDSHGRTGYDAHVGERGVKLSGGQRQRIAIARVMLKDAPILVLDEATSALDSEVEAVIQSSLYQLMQGKTVMAIAHRLSTIAAMDRLIVLDNGEIIEQDVYKRQPRLVIITSLSTSGRPKSSKLGICVVMVRNTMPTFSCCTNTFTRKRPIPAG